MLYGMFVIGVLRREIDLIVQAYDGDIPVGTILCKQEHHRDKLNRGYLAMLSTKESHRGRGIGMSSHSTRNDQRLGKTNYKADDFESQRLISLD